MKRVGEGFTTNECEGRRESPSSYSIVRWSLMHIEGSSHRSKRRKRERLNGRGALSRVERASEEKTDHYAIAGPYKERGRSDAEVQRADGAQRSRRAHYMKDPASSLYDFREVQWSEAKATGVWTQTDMSWWHVIEWIGALSFRVLPLPVLPTDLPIEDCMCSPTALFKSDNDEQVKGAHVMTIHWLARVFNPWRTSGQLSGPRRGAIDWHASQIATGALGSEDAERLNYSRMSSLLSESIPTSSLLWGILADHRIGATSTRSRFTRSSFRASKSSTENWSKSKEKNKIEERDQWTKKGAEHSRKVTSELQWLWAHGAVWISVPIAAIEYQLRSMQWERISRRK